MSAMPEMVVAQPSRAPSRRRRRYQSGARPERYIRTIVMTLIGTAATAFWVGGFARMTVIGYHVNHLQGELSQIQQSNRVLQDREAALADSSRVSAAAVRLAMVKATPSQTIFIRQAAPVTPPAPTIVAYAPEGGL